MAADFTAVRIANVTLTANTWQKITLTGSADANNVGRYRKLEILHCGNVTDELYYQLASSEAALASFAVGAEEMSVCAAGERISVNVPSGGDVWLGVICTSAARLSVEGLA